MTKITQALIFAAGHATRMRPLTDHLPKPLLEVAGKPLLTHIIEHLITEGVTKIVVNGHHAIEPLKAYMAKIRSDYPQREFILSEETELLETGGGAVQAMQYFDPSKPLYMINGDAFWINRAGGRTLQDLAAAWSPTDHDMILLLHPSDDIGDYDIHEGRAIRSHRKDGAFGFAGVRICMPAVLAGRKPERFSFLEIMDGCESQGRLGGLVHQGQWYHLSTPDDLNDPVLLRQES
jgi:MurNAc alpha-1-phosphate uridylyltransferase